MSSLVVDLPSRIQHRYRGGSDLGRSGVEKLEQIIGAPAAQQTGATSSHEKNGVQAPAGSHSGDPTTDTSKEATSAATQGKTGIPKAQILRLAKNQPRAMWKPVPLMSLSLRRVTQGKKIRQPKASWSQLLPPAAVADRGTPRLMSWLLFPELLTQSSRLNRLFRISDSRAQSSTRKSLTNWLPPLGRWGFFSLSSCARYPSPLQSFPMRGTSSSWEEASAGVAAGW